MVMRISFTGDILSYACQNKHARIGINRYDFDSCFDEIKPILDQSDYVVGSLETPLAGFANGYTNNHINFNTPDDFAISLKKAGFDMVTTANNHCLDRGIKGLLRTIKVLDDVGLDHTGTCSIINDRRYLVKDFGDVKVSFISFTYGTNSDDNGCFLDENLHLVNLTRKQDAYRRTFIKQLFLNCFNVLPLKLKDKIKPTKKSKIIEDSVNENEINSKTNERYVSSMVECIKEAKRQSDIVVLCLHSGGQFNSEVGSYTRWLIDKIIDAGANVVVCNHTHSILPIERRPNGAIVAYSLGNFLFTPGVGYYVEGVLADYSAILNITINNKEVSGYDYQFCKNVLVDEMKSDVRVVPLEQKMDDDIFPLLENRIRVLE